MEKPTNDIPSETAETVQKKNSSNTEQTVEEEKVEPQPETEEVQVRSLCVEKPTPVRSATRASLMKHAVDHETIL